MLVLIATSFWNRDAYGTYDRFPMDTV